MCDEQNNASNHPLQTANWIRRLLAICGLTSRQQLIDRQVQQRYQNSLLILIVIIDRRYCLSQAAGNMAHRRPVVSVDYERVQRMLQNAWQGRRSRIVIPTRKSCPGTYPLIIGSRCHHRQLTGSNLNSILRGLMQITHESNRLPEKEPSHLRDSSNDRYDLHGQLPPIGWPLGCYHTKRHSRSSARDAGAARGWSRARRRRASGRVSGCGSRSGSVLAVRAR
jgi:hypothetical protein